ncbi:hypothetical protein V8C44DRAFT_322597 [Trichoderma aethiopicum]
MREQRLPRSKSNQFVCSPLYLAFIRVGVIHSHSSKSGRVTFLADPQQGPHHPPIPRRLVASFPSPRRLLRFLSRASITPLIGPPSSGVYIHEPRIDLYIGRVPRLTLLFFTTLRWSPSYIFINPLHEHGLVLLLVPCRSHSHREDERQGKRQRSALPKAIDSFHHRPSRLTAGEDQPLYRLNIRENPSQVGSSTNRIARPPPAQHYVHMGGTSAHPCPVVYCPLLPHHQYDKRGL